jgi:hypothetical protein
MKKFLLFIFISSSISLSAQQHFIGFKAGLLSSNINQLQQDYDYYEYTRNLNSITLGFSYDFVFKSNFTLGAELNYNRKGFTNGVSVQINFDNNFNRYELSSKYISLPLKIGYQIGNKAFFDIHTGIISSLRISNDFKEFDKEGNEIYKPLYFEQYTGSYMEASAFLEMGVGYMFERGNRAFISYAFQQSFTNISDWKKSDDLFFYAMSVCIGVQYKL